MNENETKKQTSEAARMLGQIKTERKAEAARENGKRGGRPLTHFMHIVTGSIDDREGWMCSYSREELAERKLTAEEAFDADKGKTLIPVSARRKR